jgi:DNA oxidative demethylase
MGDLFITEAEPRMDLGVGAVLLRRFAIATERELISALETVVAAAPFRHMVTPGGQTMSVAMTNCGNAGWVTDRKGYRYDRIDPLTGRSCL